MNRIFYLSVCSCFCLNTALAQHHDDHNETIEEMVVTSPLTKNASDSAMPVNIISDEALRENAASTLGETLQSQIGIYSASFGPGVGLPIIRGQSGNRIRVLQDGNGNLDVSTISQDHANSVEALLAERIEVIRGPSTLLYGNGAIGGVINIIDNRIPEESPGGFNGAIELRHQTVNDENTAVFKLDGGNDSFAWHLDGLSRKSDVTEIPGLAIDIEAVEAAEHDEDESHEGEPLENTNGFIANSKTEAQSLTAGFSFISEHGFWGLSFSQFENEYGIPPGAHAHGEHEDGEEEHEEENIRIDMEQTRIDLKGQLLSDGFIKQTDLRVSLNDYEHKELEGTEIGTIFTNEGSEMRLTLRQDEHDAMQGTIDGVFGLHFIDREFAAIGEEAFIPKSDIRSMGLFAVESLSRNDWIYEFGVRLDKQTVDPSSLCRTDHNTFSSSISAIWNFQEDRNIMVAVNRSQRSASIEEFFSNISHLSCAEPSDQELLVIHAATAQYEIGNPALDKETANNIEFGFRKHSGNIRSEINIYHNQISNYIYLADTEEEFEEVHISRYQQQDATFTGIEAEITIPFEFGEDKHADLVLFGDMVNAELDDGSNLPRIPPMRLGFELAYYQADWGLKLRASFVSKQDNVAHEEQATDGHTLVDLHYDYHADINSREFVFFIKGKNLLDEEIRNHTSFLKNFAPLAGRSFEAGSRFYF